MAHVDKAALDWVPIDSERPKRVYDRMVTDAGVTLLFNTVLSAVEKEDETHVASLLISNKAGVSALKARVYIDCTGDADLVAWAGHPFQKRDDEGATQPATHFAHFSSVDIGIASLERNGVSFEGFEDDFGGGMGC